MRKNGFFINKKIIVNIIETNDKKVSMIIKDILNFLKIIIQKI